jgi:hypothetical protein
MQSQRNEASSTYKDLNEFLAKHTAKDKKKIDKTAGFTHTRIPDKELNIYGGSYIIPKKEKSIFNKLYYESIFVKKHNEYLTEKQLENGGPMAVDFDFRYNYDITKRQHNKEHIVDMVCEYSDALKEYYVIEPNKPIDVFIFEKPNVNRLADGSLTKDGIHMIFGMKINFAVQLMIRDKMIQKLPLIWDELHLSNTWDSVLDEGISTGKTNWQLFGSQKPGNKAYELTHHYVLTIDPSDNQFQFEEPEVSEFDLKNNFENLSVQYDEIPEFPLKAGVITKSKPLSVKTSKADIETDTETIPSPIEVKNNCSPEYKKLEYFIRNGFDDGDFSHTQMCDIGYALNQELANDGLELYLTIAKKYSDHYDEAEYKQKYQEHLKPTRSKIGIATIYYHFKKINPTLFKELNDKYKSILKDEKKEEKINEILNNGNIHITDDNHCANILFEEYKDCYICAQGQIFTNSVISGQMIKIKLIIYYLMLFWKRKCLNLTRKQILKRRIVNMLKMPKIFAKHFIAN